MTTRPRPLALALAAAGLCTVGLAVSHAPTADAQGNNPPFALTDAQKADLRAREERLAALVRQLREGGKATDEQIADVEIFLRLSQFSQQMAEVRSTGNLNNVLRGLDSGAARAQALLRGETPWRTTPGSAIRGFRSRIDGTLQPYALRLPTGYDGKTPMRLDVVLHGRGTTEPAFLGNERPGAAPNNDPFITLEVFGRGNNGYRWAGETDVFEALAQVRKSYPIDPNRVILRGFSMGGHGAWQIGMHTPGLWAAISPGAGFSDTRNYVADYRTGKIMPPSYQLDGWHIYDAVDYALNAFNLPVIAYGGDKDPQLQAALNMKEAMAKEGLELNLVVGPDTEHRYHPESLKQIMAFLATKTLDPTPRHVKFTTWTLKYPQSHWLRVEGLQRHYQRALVDAQVTDQGQLLVKTQNVTHLALTPPRALAGAAPRLAVDGQSVTLRAADLQGDPLRLNLARVDGKWQLTRGEPKGRRKRPGLQGPIDDAMTDTFVAVTGTGTPWSAATQAWADASLQRFQGDWRLGFRGETPVKKDTEITDADIRTSNLLLFGDPGSNRVLARILDRMPVSWTEKALRVNGQMYGTDHVPVLVYPNPLNPQRYVVVNSGHTFRRSDINGTNALLTPKLPDWAVLKLEGPAETVVTADYFDEEWRFRK